MLTADLPACALCGSNRYEPRGANLSPSLCQQGFRCLSCNADIVLLSMDVCHLLMFAATPAHFEYVNGVLLSTWRAWIEHVTPFREQIYGDLRRQSLEELGIPEDADVFKLPEGIRRQQHERMEELNRLHSLQLRFPPGSEPCPLPPKMPRDMTAMVKPHDVWTRIKPEDTAHLPVSPDPIRVRHDRIFNEIFTTVRLGLDIKFDRITMIPNEYFDDKYQRQPWYTLEVGNGDIVIGPRKRVIEIRALMKEPHMRMNVEELLSMADQDGVTWNCSGPPRAASACEIHAWGQAKATEYLSVLIQRVKVSR
jgi:hypothetical protein